MCKCNRRFKNGQGVVLEHRTMLCAGITCVVGADYFSQVITPILYEVAKVLKVGIWIPVELERRPVI